MAEKFKIWILNFCRLMSGQRKWQTSNANTENKIPQSCRLFLLLFYFFNTINLISEKKKNVSKQDRDRR